MYACINNPFWQSSGIIIIMCKFYIVISGKLIGPWMCFLFLAVILSGLHENPRRKDYRKKYIQQFVWSSSLFWLHALLLMSLFATFSSLLPPVSTPLLKHTDFNCKYTPSKCLRYFWPSIEDSGILNPLLHNVRKWSDTL